MTAKTTGIAQNGTQTLYDTYGTRNKYAGAFFVQKQVVIVFFMWYNDFVINLYYSFFAGRCILIQINPGIVEYIITQRIIMDEKQQYGT